MRTRERAVQMVGLLAPAPLVGGFGARHLFRRNVMVHKRTWMIIVSGFFEPVFYLFSIGVGLGALIGDLQGPNGPIDYTAFVAPALLGSSAMMGAVNESTYNIFFKLRYGKVYDAMLSTPLQPGDIAIGEIGWSLFRGAIYAAAFLVVMVVMGLVASPWAIMAIPAALLIGFAFASVGMAASTFMKSWQDLELVGLSTLPLFLFSATFYPLEVYPGAIQAVARFSPLYHGVELIRSLTLGIFDWSIVGHIGVLVGMGAVGAWFTSRRLTRLLMA